VDTDGATLGAFAPRPHLEPLFQAMAMSGGKIRSCDWRPRSDWGLPNATTFERVA